MDSYRFLMKMFQFMIQREADALKIKTKMLEDQTETIRKLKEVYQCKYSYINNQTVNI